MKFIDAHHHTWDLSVFPYSWMNDPHPIGDLSDIKKNYVIVIKKTVYTNMKHSQI